MQYIFGQACTNLEQSCTRSSQIDKYTHMCNRVDKLKPDTHSIMHTLVSVSDPNQHQRGSLSVYCKQYMCWIKGLGMRLTHCTLIQQTMYSAGQIVCFSCPCTTVHAPLSMHTLLLSFQWSVSYKIIQEL